MAWPRPSGTCWRGERLAAPGHGGFEFESGIEMLDDGGLAAARHEDELFDARFARFIDGVLDQRSIDDRQHLLGDGFGGWKKTCAQTRDGENGFTNGFDR
jgi:hypothetical protein